MRNYLHFSLCLLAFFLLFSCKKSDIVYQKDFDKSYNALQVFKAQSHNSYTYTVNGGSWVGIGWETTITVESGKVVRRSYKEQFPPNIQIPDGREMEWAESNTAIGSHTHTAAAAPLTLDEVYAQAREEWLKRGKDKHFYFETENNGLISLCGYFPDGCQDDCFVGISIASITAATD